MPRLIDADALSRKICGMKCGCERDECGYDDAACPTVALIETAPTVSPDEVRGVGCPVCQCKEPLPEDGMSHEYYIRGNTMYHYDTHFGWEGSEISYCPECGAKMEVKE